VIDERFYQPVTSPALWSFGGSFPGTDPNNDADWFGFVEPFGPAISAPGRLTEYAGGTGSARMEWHGAYQSRGMPFLDGRGFLLHAGDHLAEAFGAYPLHPAAAVRTQPLR